MPSGLFQISNYLKLRFWKRFNVPVWLSSVGTRDFEGTQQHCSWSSSPHQTWSTPPWFSHSMHWQCWSQSKPSSETREEKTCTLHRCMQEHPFLCKTFAFLFYWSFTSLLFLEASIDYKQGSYYCLSKLYTLFHISGSTGLEQMGHSMYQQIQVHWNGEKAIIFWKYRSKLWGSWVSFSVSWLAALLIILPSGVYHPVKGIFK